MIYLMTEKLRFLENISFKKNLEIIFDTNKKTY